MSIYPYEESDGRGERGAHWRKRMFDILALVWALIRGRVLIRTWALIRGNTVSNLMFEERQKPSCKKTAIYLVFFSINFL